MTIEEFKLILENKSIYLMDEPYKNGQYVWVLRYDDIYRNAIERNLRIYNLKYFRDIAQFNAPMYGGFSDSSCSVSIRNTNPYIFEITGLTPVVFAFSSAITAE